VSSAEQYRTYADECFGWARTAKTAREREIFIQMAQTWLAAAVRAGAGDNASRTIQPSVSPATIAKQQTCS
jgi:hypothetical protein